MNTVKAPFELLDAQGATITLEVSPNIKVDNEARRVFVRDLPDPVTNEEWESTRIEFSWLPPSALVPKPTRLVENSGLFEVYLLGLDVFATKRREGKSFCKSVRAWTSNFKKIAEFAWLNGFYDLRDIPTQLWAQLHLDIALGGWVKALRIEQRTIDFLANVDRSVESFFDRDREKNKINLRAEILNLIGTNIGNRQLPVVKEIVLQALNNSDLQRSGDASLYKIAKDKKLVSGRIFSIIDSIDILAQIAPDKAVMNLPGGSRFKLSRKYGKTESRTDNIDPNDWAKVLTYAYQWIFDYSPALIEFVTALAAAQQEMVASGKPVGRDGDLNYKDRWKLVKRLPEMEKVESTLGVKITTFQKRIFSDSKASVNSILNFLYTACYIVLISMNARRKDEVIGKAIGLHADSLRRIDEVFSLYECEFYMEKHIQDYRWHLVNRASQRALEVLGALSNVTWGLLDEPGKPTVGRGRKLFLLPNFGMEGIRMARWYSISCHNAGSLFSIFIKEAVGESVRITSHMFRRGYGLLYHYRYENAQLIALSQKYGHDDVIQTLHYVNDSLGKPQEKTAIAKWASRNRKSIGAEETQLDEMQKIVREVGREKLRSYVAEIVDSSRAFSGGFSKLVARFHRKMGSLVSYSSLDTVGQKKMLTDALVARGHEPYPYPWGNCMAGNSRKHSACTIGKGEISRENASPISCGRCAYSDTSLVHLQNLEADAIAMQRLVDKGGKTLREIAIAAELDALKRIIFLHKSRLQESQ